MNLVLMEDQTGTERVTLPVLLQEFTPLLSGIIINVVLQVCQKLLLTHQKLLCQIQLLQTLIATEMVMDLLISLLQVVSDHILLTGQPAMGAG
ncbi:hypothetical protein ES708_30001 [subsurface metagenome]